MSQIIEIKVREKKAQTDFSDVVSFNGVYRLRFDFDEEWKDFPNRVAVVYWEHGSSKELFSGNEVDMPQISSVHSEHVFVGVYSKANGKRISSSRVKLRCIPGTCDAPEKVSKTVHEQLLDKLNQNELTPNKGSLYVGEKRYDGSADVSISREDLGVTNSYEDLTGKPTNLVTTDTEQTVTGEKTFSKSVIIGDLDNGIQINPQSMVIAALSNKASKPVKLPDKMGTFALKEDVVSLEGEQEIPGEKTFTAARGIKVKDAESGKTTTVEPSGIFIGYGSNQASRENPVTYMRLDTTGIYLNDDVGSESRNSKSFTFPSASGQLATLDDLTAGGGVSEDAVTLDTEQTITGEKTFSKSVIIGDLESGIQINPKAKAIAVLSEKASKPVLLPDKMGTFALKEDVVSLEGEQEIPGEKTFTAARGIKVKDAESGKTTNVEPSGIFIGYGSKDASAEHPVTYLRLDTSGIYLNDDVGSASRNPKSFTFPSASGQLATLNDLSAVGGGGGGGGGESAYDTVIKTQEEFDAWCAELDAGTYKGHSVLLVGLNNAENGYSQSYTHTSSLKLPNNLYVLHGAKGASIYMNGFDGTRGAIYYESIPAMTSQQRYEIRNLSVECYHSEETNDAYVFENCLNLINCRAQVANGGQNGNSCYGFYHCSFLKNCYSEASSSYHNAYAYYGCSKLESCYATVEGYNDSGKEYGFYDCNDLSNCECEYEINASYSDNYGNRGFGFYACNNLANCKVDATSNYYSSDAWKYGFYQCKKLANCESDLHSFYRAIGFHSCEECSNCIANSSCNGSNLTGTQVWAYGFISCIDLMNCKANADGADVSWAASYGVAFQKCTNLMNCEGKSISDRGQYAYESCKNLLNCKGDLTSDASDSYPNYCYYACEKMTNCEGSAVNTYTKGIGYTFYNCKFCSGCTQTADTTSKSGTWGGTNTNIIKETCPEFTE